MPLLDQRFIQKNIASVGNVCSIVEVSRSYGSDEYKTKTEDLTTTNNISCFVHILSYEDEEVKQGEARMGDLVFWFDSDQSGKLAQGNRIIWNSSTYQIINVKPFKAEGDVILLIECLTGQI